MSTPTFRSLVCSRARPELMKTGQALGNYFREFSTTQSLADNATAAPSGRGNNDSNGRGQGNARERGRAAISAINTMIRGRERSVTAPKPDGGAPAAGAGGPKVLDVRSLPRGLTRGRGGFRGSSGGGSAGPTGVNRFAAQGRGGGSGGGRGGFRGRGGAAGSRGRGGRGGRGGRRAEDGEKRDGGGRRKGGGPEADPYGVMDEAETAFDRAIRFRQPTPYDPALDVDGLLAHAPAVPTSVAGRRAAVLGSLQAMGGGTGDFIGAPSGYLPSAVEGRVQQDGLAFFATPAARGWAEEQIQAKQREDGADATTTTTTTTTTTPVFATAGEAVQKVVFEAAVAGAHETPRFATDVHGIVRAQHLRAGSYGPAATAMFEKKLRSLVGEPKPAAVEATSEAAAATPATEAERAKETKA
ncbi:hypothetical protein MY11210_002313 [Beauveria gryllotalpidicola]